ncbi:transcription factor TFIIIB component B'' isoform X3 [Lathyrus oleraceus]|uniref:Myb-like domain-containing protein n=1 Tax=Pisum sativum TaxID=3888 RepID=A0A9D4VI51_PEA|nr:transcription factor TFIIIB component B''-like isoform X3 [Pisum sativum]KAI5384343.1 hypothetical protein KIW84_071381 [Pisum sativum]
MENLFDDIAPTPTTRARPGARFAPRAKPKQPPRKNVSASKDENNVHVASSTTHNESEGVSQIESHNAVTVAFSIEEPIKSGLNNENELNNVAAPSTISSTIVKVDELPQNGEGSFLGTDKNLEVDNSREVTLNVGFESASGDNNTAIPESNSHSNFEFGQVGEVLSAEIELDPFSNVLPDPGTGNARKFQPKVKPRPRVSNTPVIASASSDFLNMTSEAVVHDGTGDLLSSFDKSAAENADILLGLESLDGILNQAATATGKPDLKSSNVKGTEENFVLPEYDNKSRSEPQEGANLNPGCPIDNVYDYQSMKSGTNPTSEIPRHEVLTNSSDSPTLADFLQLDGTREKEDANETKISLKKHKISSIAVVDDDGVKTLRQPRKQAVRKPAKTSLNEAIEDDDVLNPPYDADGDELEEKDDEYEVDYSSKKKRASTSSKKKSVAKNGKTSGKRKKANDDIEKVTEAPLKIRKTSGKRKKANDDIEKVSEAPPKKFPHSSRRRKRCVDKALLDDEFLDQRTLPIRDIILLAEYKERLAKKEAATSKVSSTNQSDRDVLHEADANNEEEFFGSDDEFRDPDDYDQASEKFTSTAPLLNYQSFMNKAPRAKWSKQDTELFYKAVSFCTDFEMIQKLFFPDKTRHQVKLKYKNEERQHPLRLSNAVNNHATDLCHFKLVAESLQQTSNKVEQDTASDDAPDFMPGEEVEDPTPGTNEEVATTQKDDIGVKDQEDPMEDQNLGQSDDSEDELQKWAQYQSAI